MTDGPRPSRGAVRKDSSIGGWAGLVGRYPPPGADIDRGMIGEIRNFHDLTPAREVISGAVPLAGASPAP
jgi:hypothetical protein